jgi:hypothetical protein
LVRDRIVQLFCRKSNPPVQKTLYIENEGDLKFSGTAKPTASPALKNWLFWFFLIRYGLHEMACKHWQEGPTDAPPAAFNSDGLSGLCLVSGLSAIGFR